MIVPGRAGGIFVTESALVTELRKQPGVTVGVFEFGSRAEHESPLDRVTGRFRDFIAFDRIARKKKPDVAYINSSYNKRALLRDIGYALISRIRQLSGTRTVRAESPYSTSTVFQRERSAPPTTFATSGFIMWSPSIDRAS